MKRFSKIWLLIISLFIIAAILCGCGQLTDGNYTNKKSGAFGSAAFRNSQDAFDESAEMEDADFDAAEEANLQSSGKSAQVTKNRKIIEYINLTVETKTFDKFIESVTATVEKSGGYIESSQIGGNSYYDEDNRTAELKIRIPKAKQSDFSGFISKNSNVVDRSVNTDDVTDQYIDIQSRIKALKIEKETLEKLLAKSSKVSDTLTVYEKLTDVIAEIESYQGRLSQMDNLVEYTTFTVFVSEVEKETQVEKQSWIKSTLNTLKDNLFNIWNGILVFLSFIISGLPYWILLGIIAVAVILIIRHFKKKSAKKPQDTNKQ